ncbi:hypothetical protein HG530_012913 [Fusarium avenaceum]|nr:hypothetical protein HG530_012913 [Fusarium avenaceum]
MHINACFSNLADRSPLSCVVNVEYEDILSTNSGQVVHNQGNLLLFNHGAYSNPTLLIKSRDCRRALPRGDLGSLGKATSLNVVLAKNIALCGDDTFDARCNEVDKLGDGWQLPHTNKIDDTLGNTQSTSSLDTATQLHDLGTHLARRHLALAVLALFELQEIVGCKVDKAGPDGLANEILGGLVLAFLGNLDLELAATKAQLHNHVRASSLLVGRRHVDGAAS